MKNKNIYLQFIISILLIYIFSISGQSIKDSTVLIYILIFVIPTILVIDGFLYYLKYRKNLLKLIILTMLTILSLVPLIIYNTKSNTLTYFLYLTIMSIIGEIIGWIYSKIKNKKE